MQDRVRSEKDLTNKSTSFSNEESLDKEKEILTILDSLSEKIKLLETKRTAKASEEDYCNFKHACYTAKSKMGPCPCELYR